MIQLAKVRDRVLDADSPCRFLPLHGHFQGRTAAGKHAPRAIEDSPAGFRGGRK